MLIQSAPLILGSGSTIRQQMLKAVGLTFSVVPSGVDETALEAGFSGETIPELALLLARAKALAVSRMEKNAYVIGADQLCVYGDVILQKPGSYENAEAQLAALAGDTHHQHCGVVIARGGEVIWEHAAQANLTMRSLSPAEIRSYVAADAPLASCGAYKFEGLGRHLFSYVAGDHDVIQGLPLVPLLAQLHALHVIALA